MKSKEMEAQIEGVASLREPARRALYLYVVERGGEVGREEAARAVHLSRPLAAFHLDKLVDQGLLEPVYRRLSGRRGPGAGRPAKLYRRSGRQIEVCLPPREYELAARLLLRALAESNVPEARQALTRVARELGRSLGESARRDSGADAGDEARLRVAAELLDRHGFEPQRLENRELRLRNCPFHGLTNDNRELVCGMNLAMQEGIVEGLQLEDLRAVLDPRPGMCCVAFTPAGPRS